MTEIDVATPFYLREAAARLTLAADRLDAQDGVHREFALAEIRLATRDTELCTRRILRQFAPTTEVTK